MAQQKGKKVVIRRRRERKNIENGAVHIQSTVAYAFDLGFGIFQPAFDARLQITENRCIKAYSVILYCDTVALRSREDVNPDISSILLLAYTMPYSIFHQWLKNQGRNEEVFVFNIPLHR